MIKNRCKNCLWFDHEHKSLEGVPKNFGYCRKHRPVVYSKDGRYYGGWPLVDTDDLCGEFREDK